MNNARLGWTTWVQAGFFSIFALVVMAFGAVPIYADHAGLPAESGTTEGVCMVERYNNTKPASVSDLNCTSNDVQLAIYEVRTGPAACSEGEIVNVQLRGNFIPTSNERWDVGVFVAQHLGATPNSLTTPNSYCVGGTEDGNSCLSGSYYGEDCELGGGTCTGTGAAECYSDYLHPVSADNTDLQLNSICSGGTQDGSLCIDAASTLACQVGGGACGIAAGPYYNGEITEDPGDQCADVAQGTESTFDTGLFDIVCQDLNGNGLADVTNCTVWANSRSDGSANKPSCIDESDVTAETSAKCTCEIVDILGLEINKTAHIEVVKDLTPASSTSTFDLRIDGAVEKDEAGDGDSTGMVEVTAGTNFLPGDTHTVDETSGDVGSLASYTSDIECVDRGETTFGGTCSGGTARLCDGGIQDGFLCDTGDDAACLAGGGTCTDILDCDPNGTSDSDACIAGGGTCNANGSSITVSGAGPINVPVVPGQDVVCTITNVNVCESNTCDSQDTFCADFECDPAGTLGNCDIVTYNTGATCRAGSGDICDPPEVCVEGQAACPSDIVTPATTTCRTGSGDLCDPDESCTGVAGQACPADVVASATTICNPGSGDICDPDESCTGVAGQACPSDTIASATTICRVGSGDICDPDESCTGQADAACPPDDVASVTTICRPGDPEICNPDESCTGVAGAACPADVNYEVCAGQASISIRDVLITDADKRDGTADGSFKVRNESGPDVYATLGPVWLEFVAKGKKGVTGIFEGDCTFVPEASGYELAPNETALFAFSCIDLAWVEGALTSLANAKELTVFVYIDGVTNQTGNLRDKLFFASSSAYSLNGN